ncbi:MAG: hypothetical protein JSU91_05655, partial [Thermoplasmatales archaeon]
MYLITKWFGTFLCDKGKIVDKILFAKDPKTLSKKIIKIHKNEILSEEKKILKNIENVIVNEKRLKKIGDYKPSDPFFKNFQIKADEYDFSKELLYKATVLATKNNVEKKLESEDLQIIQMVNTLDDFIQTSNLLHERLESWSILPTPKEKIEPLKNSYASIKNEIKSLENQIEKD